MINFLVLKNLNVGWNGPFPIRVEEPKQRLVFFFVFFLGGGGLGFLVCLFVCLFFVNLLFVLFLLFFCYFLTLRTIAWMIFTW